MKVTMKKERFTFVVDALLERQRKKLLPYNENGATVPQYLIPDEIRSNTHTLACFYFFLCIYMRGGIESHTAFRQLIKMWFKHPKFFDPKLASQIKESEITEVLKEYVGWDSKNAARFWSLNAKRLAKQWGSNPLELIKGLSDYNEAVRRIARKTTKQKNLDTKDDGFYGFQEKMVSMLLYFYDWEGWLPKFLYPSPADFHHYRLFIANEAIIVKTSNGNKIRYSKQISAVIRKGLLDYLKANTNTTTIELADALWLYSFSMCGNSPATITKVSIDTKELFRKAGIEEWWNFDGWINTRTKSLAKTCVVCVLGKTCKFGIPARSYYSRGIIELRPRPQIQYFPTQNEINNSPTETGEQLLLFKPDK